MITKYLKKIKVLGVFLLVFVFLLTPTAQAYQWPVGTPSVNLPVKKPIITVPQQQLKQLDPKVLQIKTQNGVLKLPRQRPLITKQQLFKLKPSLKDKQVVRSVTKEQILNSIQKRQLNFGGEINYSVNLDTVKPLQPLKMLPKKSDSLVMLGIYRPAEKRKPERIVLRWSPNPKKTWIPENGYDLYRIVGGEKHKIASGLGSDRDRQQKFKKLEKTKPPTAPDFAVLAEQAKITPEKLKKLNVKSEKQLREMMYSDKIENLQIISGRDRFVTRFKHTFMLPERGHFGPYYNDVKTFKLEETHPLIQNMPAIDNTSRSIKPNFKIPQEKLFRIQSSRPRKVFDAPAGTDPVMLQIKEAQNAILTTSNVDQEFAEAYGLSYVDTNISTLGIKKGSVIRYQLVVSDSQASAIAEAEVTYGEIKLPSKPTELEGYGANNKVFLRWQIPADRDSREVISGYIIERKKKGENSFKPLNEGKPTVIAYNKQGDKLYEPEVYFIDDTLKNGESASYRVCAIDVFGQKTLPSTDEGLKISVIKTTPPPAPDLKQPVLSKTKNYITVPFTHSLEFEKENEKLKPYLAEDVVSYKIYRSSALGTNEFSYPPELKCEIILKKDDMQNPKVIVYKDGNGQTDPEVVNIPSDLSENLRFIDEDIQKGYFYQYWVQAVDKWNNESMWSKSKIIGCPSPYKPDEPTGVSIEFNENPDIKNIIKPPGFQQRYKYQEETVKNTANLLSKSGKKKDAVIAANEDSMVQTGMVMNTFVSPAQVNLEYMCIKHYPKSALQIDGSLILSWMPCTEAKTLKGYTVLMTMNPTEESDQHVYNNLLWMAQGFSEGNQFVFQGPRPGTEEYELLDDYLYFMVVPVFDEKETSAEDTESTDIGSILLPGGYVRLTWTMPDDPQIKYYRIHRAERNGNIKLEWSLVAENVKQPFYKERVDQTKAHDYYYKITPVTVWGVEGNPYETASPIHIPTTIPPAAPQLLMPEEGYGAIKIKWKSVPDAIKYNIYRKEVPKISKKDLAKIVSLKNSLGEIPLTTTVQTLNHSINLKPDIQLEKPIVNPDVLKNTLFAKNKAELIKANKMAAVKQVDKSALKQKLSQLNDSQKLQIVKEILNKYGALALQPYGRLDEATARELEWEVVKEDFTIQPDENGVCEWTDETPEYGTDYLYAVSAVNADNLESDRQQVSATPLKGDPPAPPVIDSTRTKPTRAGNQLVWNEYVPQGEGESGYVVFRSFRQSGPYQQISPLLEKPEFTDTTAVWGRTFWYTVKIVDEVGLVSEGSTPVKLTNTSNLMLLGEYTIPVYPDIPEVIEFNHPPKLNFKIQADLPTDFRLKLPPVDRTLPGKIDSVIGNQPSTNIAGFEVVKNPKESTGMLIIPGVGPVPVNINEVDKFSFDSVVELAQKPTTLSFNKQSAVVFTKLSIANRSSFATVSGKLKIPGASEIAFEDAKMSLNSSNTAVINLTNNCPDIQVGEYMLEDIKSITIPLNTAEDLIIRGGNLVVGMDLIYSDYSSEDKLGLVLQCKEDAHLDYQGRLTGEFIGLKQELPLAVPRALALAVSTAKLKLVKNSAGVVAADTVNSYIRGNILMMSLEKPFDSVLNITPKLRNTLIKPYSVQNINFSKQAVDLSKTPIKPQQFIKNNLKDLKTKSYLTLSQQEKVVINESLEYLIDRLDIYTPSSENFENPSVAFSLNHWAGSGFSVESTSNTAFYVGQGGDLDRFKFKTNKITIDLSADESPQNCPAGLGSRWVGLVMEDVAVKLPQSIKKADGGLVEIGMPKEVYYDLSGIRCQYDDTSSSSENNQENIALYGFDGTLFEAAVSVYANKLKAQLSGNVQVPILKNVPNADERVLGFKYLIDDNQKTSSINIDKKMINRNQKVELDVSGGRLEGRTADKGDIYLDGNIRINADDKLTTPQLEFAELKIPSEWANGQEINDVSPEEKMLYGFAMFSKPGSGTVADNFSMEIRSLRFCSPGHMKLSGGIRLAENLPLNMKAEADDIVILDALSPNANIPIAGIKARLKFVYEDIVCIARDLRLGINDGNYEFVVDTEDLESQINEIVDEVNRPVSQVRAEIQKLEGAIDKFNNYSNKAGKLADMFGFDFGVEGLDFNSAVNFLDKTDEFLAETEIDHASFGGSVAVRIGKNGDTEYWAVKLGLDDELAFGPFFSLEDNFKAGLGYNVDVANVSASIRQWPLKSDGYISFVADGFTLKVSDIFKVENAYLLIASGPSIELRGAFTLNAMDMDFELGEASIGYYHPATFKASAAFSDIQPPFFGASASMSGSAGFTAGPSLWGIAVGYPDIVSIRTPDMMKYGLGFAVEGGTDEQGDLICLVKARALIGADTGEMTFGIVYLQASIEAEAGLELDFGDPQVVAVIIIRGSGRGGIVVGDSSYDIIRLAIELAGRFWSDFDNYTVSGDAKICYHLDLFLIEYSGSQEWHIEYP